MPSEDRKSYLYIDRSPRGELSVEHTAKRARSEKAQYQRYLDAHSSWGAGLGESELIVEMNRAGAGMVENMRFLLRSVNPVVQPMLALNCDTALRWYRYAYQGLPVWFYESKSGKNVEIGVSETRPVDLHEDFNAVLAYNEYFDAPFSASGADSTYVLDVVINKAMARFKLDWYPYTNESGALSIAEVALLAGMSERSVRNVAFSELGAISKSDSKIGMTYVSSEKAIDWLKGRRKFVPSSILESKMNIDLMLDFMDTYAS